MPYIDKSTRTLVDNKIDSIAELINSANDDMRDGITNYVISRIVTEGLKLPDEKLRYYTAQDMIGVLECAKLEVYRRLVAPYENKCIEKNGDIPAYIGPRYFINPSPTCTWYIKYENGKSSYHSKQPTDINQKAFAGSWPLKTILDFVDRGWKEVSEEQAKERMNSNV